ncbi:MAG: EVE domain-containing protein [Phycisphaerales bacterium]|nr:EVE domain-containing protein [Phycisphaerales bacterium]MCI0632269.1 EVE domain-containing protein [Phycisphaerales bacterium]MCI0674538.1 EVE domain-containing protein [Phycisphaerales bacterium]
MAQHWLMKSEPETYSIDDLKRDKRTGWANVRSYQARNYMRDQMKVGDLVLFYHSGGDEPGVAGIARVCREAHPDPTALDKRSEYFDPKATKGNPIWMMVDVEFVEKLPHPVSLKAMKAEPKLKGMMVLQPGHRPSVQPVSPEHFQLVRKMGTIRPDR